MAFTSANTNATTSTLGGLAEGLNQGLMAFTQARRQAAQDDMEKQKFNLDLAGKGYRVNPDTNQLELTDTGQAQQKLGLLKMNDELASYDPNSKSAQNITEINKGLLKQSGLSNVDISGMSPQQQKDFLNPQLDTAAKLAATKAQRESLRNDKTIKELSGIQDALTKNKEYAKAQGITSSADEAQATIQDALKNPASANAVPLILAKMSTGGQRLNETEIKAMGGSQALDAKLAQVVQNAKAGTLTPENAAFMSQYVEVQRAAAERAATKTELTYAKNYASNHGIPVEDAYAKITGGKAFPTASPSAPAGLIGQTKLDPQVRANMIKALQAKGVLN